MRKYISVLSILKTIIKQMENVGEPMVTVPPSAGGPLFRIRPLPVEVPDGPEGQGKDATEVPDGPEGQGKDGASIRPGEPELREVTVAASLGTFSGTAFTLPYFMETEYLRTSEFLLQKEELQLVEQMFLLTVIVYAQMVSKTKRYSPSVVLASMTDILEADDLVWEIGQQGRKGAVEGILKKIYASQFHTDAMTPKAQVPTGYGNWYALPRSSRDAMYLHKEMYHAEFEEDIYVSRFLLYLPYMMVYSLLERDTKKFKETDYKSYAAYKREIQNYRKYDSMEPDIVEPITKDSPHYRSFSYGRWQRSDVQAEATGDIGGVEDADFIKKILAHIFYQRKLVSNKNITTLSVNQDTALSDEDLTSVNLRLNAMKLNWEES